MLAAPSNGDEWTRATRRAHRPAWLLPFPPHRLLVRIRRRAASAAHTLLNSPPARERARFTYCCARHASSPAATAAFARPGLLRLPQQRRPPRGAPSARGPRPLPRLTGPCGRATQSPFRRPPLKGLAEHQRALACRLRAIANAPLPPRPSKGLRTKLTTTGQSH